jgi:thioredoxin reductase
VPSTVDVVVIGGGQAGLSAAYALQRGGTGGDAGFVVLDANPAPGGAWQHRWDGLRLDDVHGLHPLPGATTVPDDPDTPANRIVPAYFADYEHTHDLPVARPVTVTAVHDRRDGRLDVVTDGGTVVARALINATGTWTEPFVPAVPGAGTFGGRQRHTADYRDAEELADGHVVVVGGGTSAIEHLDAVSKVTTTSWVTRRPPRWREAPFDATAGREAVGLVERRVRAGRRPESVVSVTGLPVTDRIRDLRARGVLTRIPMFDRLDAGGPVWSTPVSVGGRTVDHLDARTILWATGFRPALGHLAPLRLRERTGGIALDGTRAARDPRVHLVGYGPSASTIGANRAGRVAAGAVRRWIASQAGSAATA